TWWCSWASWLPTFTGNSIGFTSWGTSSRSSCRSGAPSPVPFESPAGVNQPTRAKLDVPGADFWYVEDGKIKQFNCYVSVSIMLEQMGIQPDFASAVGAHCLPSTGSVRPQSRSDHCRK